MANFLLFFVFASFLLPLVPAQNIFSVQWGSSVCLAKGNTCTGTKTPTEFTIHGLWPPSNTGTCPTPLQPTDIGGLIDKLTKAWPNVFYYGVANPTANYFKFWSEEWRKHGCFYHGLSGNQYFQLSLDIYKALGSIKQDLSSPDCRPGLPCDLSKALATYDAKHPDWQPRIVCTVNKAGNYQLQELRFKVSVTGDLETLGGTRTQGCGSSATVSFPSPITSTLGEEALSEALLISQTI